MGCDIHLLVERQVDEKWITVRLFQGFHCRFSQNKYASPVALARNYVRFAALAGVRGDGPEPRGIPDDLSETAKLLVDEYGDDGHSHSWLPIEEATEIFLKTEWEADKRLSDLDKKYPLYHYFGLETEIDKGPHRLIFWFDN